MEKKTKLVEMWPLAGQAVCVNHGSLIQSNEDNNPELHQLTFKLSHSFTQLMSRGSNESWIYGSLFPYILPGDNSSVSLHL